MKTATKALLFILIALILSSCGKEKKQGQAAETAKRAPDFSATDLEGKKVSLSDFRGKVVLLDFWATWCPPCREEIPELQKIFDEYKDKGLVIIGASSESSEKIRQFKQKMGISYPLLKVATKVFSAYQVRGIPTTYIIDKKGYIQHREVGFAPGRGIEERFRNIIEKLLGETEEDQ
ncbi:MAG: TlpA family protein disulfide reductase [Candidatus Latescibacteria bacterium]|nr:TlpA family protein disulfide reductase [Candidatus Latescibacterota bacterium]